MLHAVYWSAFEFSPVLCKVNNGARSDESILQYQSGDFLRKFVALTTAPVTVSIRFMFVPCGLSLVKIDIVF